MRNIFSRSLHLGFHAPRTIDQGLNLPTMHSNSILVQQKKIRPLLLRHKPCQALIHDAVEPAPSDNPYVSVLIKTVR
jgi:hypothetical protein